MENIKQRFLSLLHSAKQVKPATWTRLIFLLLAWVNQWLTSTGRNPLPFADTELYEAASWLVSGASSLYAYWYNNSFTPAAILADERLHHPERYAETDKPPGD